MNFTIGQKVVLKANPDEGWSKEEGVVIDIGRMCITVRVDEKYRTSPHDDGLREVTPEQLTYKGAIQ